jgi:hypothetical protein
MKTAIQDKKQIVALAIAYEFVAFSLCAEISHTCPSVLRHIEAYARVLADKASNVSAPVKKRAKNHGVRVRRKR